ncbi:hypothetical protein THAOC_04803 [Thalassiosira oceanica]|uniref:Uncharacterized protein n=1 Tax=Thalassiosira oceanica TaxID=159749 RepID=K0T4A6_THAOC|nr:hypothetical protein THAOC_04803 [Thalassiosira oceanica]|eukprot:EJK73563.1 hypothetical protein THAOC_04803 [Thalassiosira oceanica]
MAAVDDAGPPAVQPSPSGTDASLAYSADTDALLSATMAPGGGSPDRPTRPDEGGGFDGPDGARPAFGPHGDATSTVRAMHRRLLGLLSDPSKFAEAVEWQTLVDRGIDPAAAGGEGGGSAGGGLASFDGEFDDEASGAADEAKDVNEGADGGEGGGGKYRDQPRLIPPLPPPGLRPGRRGRPPPGPHRQPALRDRASHGHRARGGRRRRRTQPALPEVARAHAGGGPRAPHRPAGPDGHEDQRGPVQGHRRAPRGVEVDEQVQPRERVRAPRRGRRRGGRRRRRHGLRLRRPRHHDDRRRLRDGLGRDAPELLPDVRQPLRPEDAGGRGADQEGDEADRATG